MFVTVFSAVCLLSLSGVLHVCDGVQRCELSSTVCSVQNRDLNPVCTDSTPGHYHVIHR
ncbi:hypothetical protein DPMN_038502 [Dreissena polymorpha]|uniref:Secreted protein n=1 Tax=Dreissena polymorpha TaxID=45954 RepID=A0A9D4MFK9_DREPO|nr:hypothetical protein DPMN_038502 [Dreissena polymorpha]